MALATALIAGIAGGVLGARIADATRVPAAQEAASAQGVKAEPKAASTLDPKWVEYGRNWESRYRAMYPVTLDPKWVEYGRNWEYQYRAQHPAP